MAERKKKAADQTAATVKTSTRGRKPKKAEVAQVEQAVEPVAAIAPEKSSYKVACKTVLNVRSGAGKQFAIVRQIPNDSDVAVYEQADGWGRIGPNEWVMLQFLK